MVSLKMCVCLRVESGCVWQQQQLQDMLATSRRYQLILICNTWWWASKWGILCVLKQMCVSLALLRWFCRINHSLSHCSPSFNIRPSLSVLVRPFLGHSASSGVAAGTAYSPGGKQLPGDTWERFLRPHHLHRPLPLATNTRESVGREGDMCLKCPGFRGSAVLRSQVVSSVATWTLGLCSAPALYLVTAPVTLLRTLNSKHEQFKNKVSERHNINLFGFTVNKKGERGFPFFPCGSEHLNNTFS